MLVGVCRSWLEYRRQQALVVLRPSPSSFLFFNICFLITHLRMASFRSAQRKPYSVSNPCIYTSRRHLTRGTTASFTKCRRRRSVATRQGSNGSSQDEKHYNSCTNSTRSFPQQQARCLKSPLRDNPKRSRSKHVSLLLPPSINHKNLVNIWTNWHAHS